ncbi:unnamed protein product [Phaeothamnion confervicola]
MADLEEQLLKKNIPGKYSWWDPDDDEVGPNARTDWLDPDASDPEQDMSEVDRQRKFVEADVPEPVRRSIMAGEAERQRGVAKTAAKTGPKGVLNDYRAAKAAESAQRQMDREYREAALRRIAEGCRIPVEDPLAAVAADAASAAEEEAEDEFLRRNRATRLAQLRAAADRPQFGAVREVDRSEFVGAVDAVDARTHVVVHVYEPYVRACQRLNRHLELLCRRLPEVTLSIRSFAFGFAFCCLHPSCFAFSVKFLRLLSTAADADYDPVALPTLLVYRRGEVVACVTRITDDLGDEFTMVRFLHFFLSLSTVSSLFLSARAPSFLYSAVSSLLFLQLLLGAAVWLPPALRWLPLGRASRASRCFRGLVSSV